MAALPTCLWSLAVFCMVIGHKFVEAHDYSDALSKSLLFYEAQRSGKLPNTQRVDWRSDSALQDGQDNGVDLVGGYYDAGDNVKFGLPMAHTITMLSWSLIEYGNQLYMSGQLEHAMNAIQWGTDYLLKAHTEPYVLYGEVGDGDTDHNCWQRPEDMTTSRKAYKIDKDHPGSDLAGETAAALASASIVFKKSNPTYSNTLLTHAKQLFEFADKFRGKYDASIAIVKKYYGSISGYDDELLWAAIWLHRASGEDSYLNYIIQNAATLGGTTQGKITFCWDDKFAGVQVLASRLLLQGTQTNNHDVLNQYKQKADFYICACLQKSNYNVLKTQGGLLYWQAWNNIHFATSAALLLTVYSDYLTAAGQKLLCQNGQVDPSEILAVAKSQVDYILGDNPRGMSYMVGYGSNYPQQVHHRASSIVSYKKNPSFVGCREGYSAWFNRDESDPNLLVGAIVGGPDHNDNFVDARDNYEQTEPTTYNNAPMVGALARFLKGGSAGSNIIQPAPPRPLPSIPPKTNQTENHKIPVSSNSDVEIKQTMTNYWYSHRKTYYRYSVNIVNRSGKKISGLRLQVQKLYGPLWGLTRHRHGFAYRYGFPKWMKSMYPGQVLNFVYIHAAPQASISILGYKSYN